MSISFLDINFGSTFFHLLESTKKQVNIISPFIGYKTACALSDFIYESEKEIECTLITRFDREDFINRASSIAALEELINSGVKIYALKDLHTKLYIFDNESVITGSANFTFKGFYRNHEFGIYMEKEKVFAEECNNYFNGLLKEIKESGDWEVKIDKVEEEKRICDNIVASRAFDQKKSRKNISPVINKPNPVKWGAQIPLQNSTELSSNEDFIENVLNTEVEDDAKELNTGIWLKFEGSSDSRIPNNANYFELRDNKNRMRTFFPRKPRSIKEGQTLFITMVSNDIHGHETPIIVGYVESKGFKIGNTINFNDYNNKEHERYPHYVEFQNGRFLKAPIKYGISLRELARELNEELYPNYKKNFSEIIYTHRQKSHIQITQKANDYIINRLESLFNKYGVDII